MVFNFVPARSGDSGSLPCLPSCRSPGRTFLRMGIGNGQSSFLTRRIASSSPFFSREFFSS